MDRLERFVIVLMDVMMTNDMRAYVVRRSEEALKSLGEETKPT